MREIKSRWKRVDNGEWVYQTHKITCQKSVHKLTETSTENINLNTIGHYIGRKDINGKEIYECDIVRMKNDETHEEYIALIGYVEGFSMTVLIDMPGEGTGFYRVDNILSMYYEVLGNAFDNPELLSTNTLKEIGYGKSYNLSKDS